MPTKKGQNVCCTCGFTGELAQSGQCATCQQAGKRIIINELLCYANHHIDKSSAQAIWDAISNFYHPDEIKSAKSILWAVYSDILPDTHARRDSVVRPAHEKEVWDIIEAVTKVTEMSDIENGEPFIFVSCDLNRLPNHAPEEIDIASVLQKLIDREKKTVTMEKVVEKNTESITTLFNIQFQPNSYVGAAKREVPCPSSPMSQINMPTSPQNISAAPPVSIPDSNMQQTQQQQSVLVSTAGPPIQRTNGGARVVRDPNQPPSDTLKQNHMVVAYFPWYFTRRPAWKPRPRRGSGFHAGSPSEVSWKICNNKCGFVFIPRLYP